MSYFNASFQTPQGGDVKLLDADGSASISLKANDTTTSYTLKFPAAVGTSGQVLKLADGSGGLEFADEAASSINADDIASGDAPVSITTNNGNITIQSSTSNAIILNDGSNNVVTVQSDVVTVTGNITMDAANSIQFRDSALSINSSADGQLDIDADTTLQITAQTVDIDASTEVNVSGALTIGGAVNIDDTTESTSTSTGALIVDGGVGISSNLFVGGNINVTDNIIVTGDLTVNGTTTTINSNVTTIDDPVIELGTAGATETTLDRGIKYHYYESSAKIGFFGLDRDASVFTFYSDATFALNTNIVSSGTYGNAKFAGLTTTSTIDVGGDIYPTTADGAALGSATNEWSDLFLADSAVINLGSDQDVTLTHIPDTGVQLNGSSALQFRDSALSINSSADGQLDIDADATVQITAQTVDIDATTEVNVSNDLTVGGNLSMTNTFTVGVDSITSTAADTPIISTSLNASIKSFKLSSATALTYTCTLGDNSGQMLHLFYDNTNAAGSANINFGASNLYVGSGTAQYLKFTQTGQSATLVYIDGTDANSAGWRIINTGATIT